MPSSTLKAYLKNLILDKKEKFDDDFDLKWNLFSTLCFVRTEKCLDKKNDAEKEQFKDFFMNKCRTKSEKICYFLKDKHFQEDVDEIFLDFLTDSDISNASKKSSAVSRHFIKLAKLNLENPDKAIRKYNLALLYCPYYKDATNPSDCLLYAKILLKRSELFGLILNVEDALLDVEEGIKILNEFESDERNFLYCKFLYAKSIYLTLLDHKEYEHRICNLELESTIEKFKLNDVLKEKLNKCYNSLNQIFVANKEHRRNECIRNKSKINLNELKANAKLPGASTNLEMCLIDGKGRCTRATRTIKSGQVLFVESPIVTWLRPTCYKFYCNNCFARIGNHFMTCTSCVKVKYCSSDCRDEAWEKYHEKECKLLDCLQYLGYGQMVIRTMLVFDDYLKMINVLVKDFNTEIMNSEDENSDASKIEKSESTESVANEDDILRQQNLSPRALIENNESLDSSYWVENGFPSEPDYQSFFSLVGDEKHLNYFQLISFCYGVSLLGRFCRKMNIVGAENDRFYYVFHSAIFSHILKINLNCYAINDHSLTLNNKYNFFTHTNEYIKIGIAVYQSSSIISHSCDYNANKLSVGNKIVIYANQTIRKNEEITTTYGPSHTISSYRDRQSLLKNGYLFDCKCNACLNKLENYSNAFKCAVCRSGALIWNLDYTNKCMKCGFENQNLNSFISRLTKVQSEFGLIKTLLEQCSYVECKKKLKDCKKNLKSIFFSEQKLDHLYRLYMDYYSRREKYKKASRYARILSELQAEKDKDDKSLEKVLYSIKAISLMVLHLNGSVTSLTSTNKKTKKKIERVCNNYAKALNDFNEVIARQIKIVDSSFLEYLDCFETIEKFINNNNKN